MGEWAGGHMPECPAIRELKAALLATNTILTPAKLGTTRPDGSRHDAGLAMDIMLDSRAIGEKPLADQLIDAFVALHAKMKWSDILYTDWDGSRPVFFHTPGAAPFGGAEWNAEEESKSQPEAGHGLPQPYPYRLVDRGSKQPAALLAHRRLQGRTRAGTAEAAEMAR
jgi:hypothetical protein